MTELNPTQQQKRLNILCLGDSCIDSYQFGNVKRLSPEAPVPIFEPTEKIVSQGMVTNVVNNFLKLGVTTCCLSGQDYSVKKRFIDSATKKHIMRLDENKISDPIKFETVVRNLQLMKQVDAIVISDYDKGSISDKLLTDLRFHLPNEFHCPVFIDTKKKDLARFDDWFVKINKREFDSATSTCKNLIVTLGEKGTLVWNDTKTVPTKKVDVIDVCGAGDTYLAAFTYKYLLTKDVYEAVNFAHKAAAVTVQKIGVYAPTLEEINVHNW